jgi:hypothetical protein
LTIFGLLVPEQVRPDSSLEREKAALLAAPTLSPKTTRTSGDGLRMYGNASTPANIGGNTDIERADSIHSLNAGGIGPDRVRRRRNRRAPDSSLNPRALPAPRRANSLPAGPVTAVPATPKIDFGHALTKLLEPEQKLAPAPTWTLSAVNIMKYSYLNILLVFVPISWACVSRVISG